MPSQTRGRVARRAAALVPALLAVAAVAAPASAAVPAAAAVGVIGGPAHAGLYGWGAATMTDGSILIGDYWNYRIVHYRTDGTPATPYVFTGRQGFGPGTNQAPFGLGVDPFNGDVYMAEGSLPNVNRYDRNGTFITSYGVNRAVHPMTFKYPARIAVSPHEEVYIVDQWAGDIKVITPGGTLLRTVGGGQLIQPRGIAFDAGGRYWVGDQGHHRLVIYNADDTIYRTIPPPEGVSSTYELRGLTIDPRSQVVYVVNNENCRVQRFDANPGSATYGRFLSQFGSCGIGPGQFESGGREVAVDGTGNVWVGDLGGFRVNVFTPAGAVVRSVPNPPVPPADGGFNGPRGIAFDGGGNIFVTDMYNERVEKFDPQGHFLMGWGKRGDGPGQFNYPRLACVNPVTGLLIIANTDSNEIVAYTTAGQYRWAAGGLATPYGVSCSPDGTMVVADGNHHSLAVFSSTGQLLRRIGTNLGFVRGVWVDRDGSIWAAAGSGPVWHFSASGTQLLQFNAGSTTSPFGIAGNAGYVYIALSSSNQVAQYTRSGQLVAKLGGAGTALGRLRTPQGLAFGPNGHLYVVEQGNDRVSEWTVA